MHLPAPTSIRVAAAELFTTVSGGLPLENEPSAGNYSLDLRPVMPDIVQHAS